jgi:hypothetical protein
MLDFEELKPLESCAGRKGEQTIEGRKICSQKDK